jgi:3-dehydroquinate synthase
MAVAQHVRVDAPGGSYEIIIEPGLLAQLGERARDYGLDGPVVIVTNPTLQALYGEALTQALPNASLVIMPDGEQYKTLDTVAKLYADFVEAKLDRGGTVLAFGGGVVGDTAGFAAATFLRGVRLVQMPTSLLSMVDSSVGGKVGVDLPQGKNLVGAFKQPDVVLIDPDVLHTLPDREWRCGLGETIKHGLLADPALLEMISDSHKTSAADLVRRAVQVKVDVVQTDPYEHGMRAHLNLGHTFAHAIETVTEYGWAHGEAVGFGLVAAARLSHRLGLCDASVPGQVEEIVRQSGLPTRLGGLDTAAIYRAMGTDKKRQDGRLRFILLRGIAQPDIIKDVPADEVIAVLESLQ